MKASVLRYAAIGMATLSLAGFAAASTVSVGYTGPQSSNNVHLSNTSSDTSQNNNNVGAANINAQAAGSGNVNASDNTSVMGATGSGAASNSHTTTTSVDITNSGNGGLDTVAPLPSDDNVTLNTTGPQSSNNVTSTNSSTVKTTNNNNVDVENFNEQEAVSGNVNAKDNTTVGGLTSGPASNVSNTTTDLTISN